MESKAVYTLAMVFWGPLMIAVREKGSQLVDVFQIDAMLL